VAKITCPECHGKTGRWTTGDGYEEWDECQCCNRDGNSRDGKVSERRIMQFRREEAAEAARWDRIIADYQAADAAMDREYGPEHVW